MYYLVGLQDGFIHVQEEIKDIILRAIQQNDYKQLSFLLEMKSDMTLQAFYEYMKEWDCVHAFQNSFTYIPSTDQKRVEATITPYGMMVSDIGNNPMYRWFHYCYEYVLVMEILQ